MTIQDHPKFSTIQTWIDQMLINLISAQATYCAKNQKFFQGLKIPSQGKLDGNTEALIDYGLHPDDQTDSWNTFEKDKFKANTKFPCHLKLGVYESPRGWGWFASFHMHIKDLVAGEDRVVPAGRGDGRIGEILLELDRTGFEGFLSLEPHLAAFEGSAALELNPSFEERVESGTQLFAMAAEALKEILAGFPAEDGA